MKRQLFLIKFARKYPDQWFNFASDYESVSLMCATSNLGIITLKDGRFCLRSKIKADQFIAARQ